ncbi:MAG: TAXI family TRAP transporter solute-binding subunit [Azospirillum sp.]|nr:TAXI family TRAP transporter solute-binding subunit [Azospirillum sp.]
MLLQRVGIWALVGILSGVLLPMKVASAQSDVERINAGTVGIISGRVGGTYARFAQDLSDLLDERGKLRVVAILGKGSAQNVRDLIYLKGVDIAIVQSDVLADMRRNNEDRAIEKKIHYIAKLYEEEFHILAGPGINSIRDLNQKKVNVGPSGGGTLLTAGQVFKTLRIEPEYTYLPNSTALEALKMGDIDALAYVVGKPSSFFREIGSASGLHFISVPLEGGLRDNYVGSTLSHADYENLIPQNNEIRTIAVSAVMAAYNHREGSERYNKVRNFVEEFFTKLPLLQAGGGYHDKWKDVRIAAQVPNWTRVRPAANWIFENRP